MYCISVGSCSGVFCLFWEMALLVVLVFLVLACLLTPGEDQDCRGQQSFECRQGGPDPQNLLKMGVLPLKFSENCMFLKKKILGARGWTGPQGSANGSLSNTSMTKSYKSPGFATFLVGQEGPWSSTVDSPGLNVLRSIEQTQRN